MALLQHPALAVLLNHLLATCNELRQCALLELRAIVFRRVVATVDECARCLRELPARRLPQATAHFDSFCRAMGAHFLPHAARCLEALFPRGAAASAEDAALLFAPVATDLQALCTSTAIGADASAPQSGADGPALPSTPAPRRD